MTTAHEPAYPEDGMPKDRYIRYHEERARGGIALAMTAGSAAVSRDSPPAFNNVLAYQDAVVPWIKRLTDALHDHGCAAMIQLTHLGRRTAWSSGDWLPSVSSSHHHEAAHRDTPKLLEDWDITRIISDYADAAERMQAGGMDGIELEAYGHLLDQFWSPLTNEMSGPYGAQTLTSRTQFAVDVLQAIRDRVGPDFIVGVRFTADEATPGGLSTADGLEIAKRLESAGLVDFLNVIRGRIDTEAALSGVIPVQGAAYAPHLDFAGQVKAHTHLPVFHAARIPDVATARHAILNNLLDMVGMTRAHMADPHIVQKIQDGKEDSIRPCVGATYCLDRIYQGEAALCIHNPSTGREASLPHQINRAETRKHVVVVGAGPGGLEAARVAAERGHKVTVFEAADAPGGQVRLTAQSARRKEMIGIIDWRMSQCETLDVTFNFNCLADASDVMAVMPDTVVIATGGLPQMRLYEQHKDLPLVSSAWDILSRDLVVSGDVLIYDEAGDHAGLQAAEIAADTAKSVEVMTSDRSFAPNVMGLNLVPYMKSLQSKGVETTIAKRLLGVSSSDNRLAALIGSDYTPQTQTRVFDHVIVNYGTLPNADIYFELKPHAINEGAVDYEALLAGRAQQMVRNSAGSFELFRIGDAVSARNTHAAIYDAMRLMRVV